MTFSPHCCADPTARWAMSYRHLYWFLIHPEGPAPRARADARGVEVLGDDEAVAVTADLLRAHGWEPVLRYVENKACLADQPGLQAADWPRMAEAWGCPGPESATAYAAWRWIWPK